MNANEIWSGQVYAYVEYISRGKTYYPYAKPVRILRLYKQKDFEAERGRTMCEVIMLNDDETLSHKIRADGTEFTMSVRARNIYARWDEHARERSLRKQREEEWQRERNEQMEKARKEREEIAARREAELQERLRREEAEKNRLLNYLDLKLPRELVIGVRSTEVILDRKKLEEYLGMKKLMTTNA